MKNTFWMTAQETEDELKARAISWPDLSIDQQAFTLATCAMGANAGIPALAQRAQAIKLDILAGKLILSREEFATFLEVI